MDIVSENLVCHEILNYRYKIVQLLDSEKKDSHVDKNSLHQLSRIYD